jgi:hypothetical protein
VGTLVLALTIPAVAQAQNYYIEEDTSYSGASSPCSTNSNLNTVTSSLASALATHGGAGSRWVNGDAWPTDFTEACSTSYGSYGGNPAGTDNSWADSPQNGLAVFAGHGAQGFLQYQTAASGMCSVDFQSNMRLGQMAGSNYDSYHAAFGMWLTCDTLDPSYFNSQANYEWLSQQYGFINSIAIGDDEPRDFYNATVSSTNANAWVNEFNSDWRNPIAATFTAVSLDYCWGTHNTSKLKGGYNVASRPYAPACDEDNPYSWYCYTYAY